jgi:3-oxoacyl-ACP reductase-like protein
MSVLSDRTAKSSKKEAEPATVDDARMTPEQFAAVHAPPEPAAPPPPSPVRAPAPVKDDRPVKVRVTADAKIRLGSSVWRFRKGDMLSSQHYMPRAFRDILANVHTEPVKE